MRTLLAAAVVLMAWCLFNVSGCAKGEPDGGTVVADDHGHDHGHAHGDEHSHGDEGPHGGHIIELGGEEHHAELTHDETHKVGIYLLGGDAKTAAPIEAESVTINVSVDGKPTQFVLPAVPQTGETDGKSSYFELVSEPLETVVAGESEAKNVQARLSLMINGKPYVGLIETAAHEHDHDHGHDH
jgi:hypothetical protein